MCFGGWALEQSVPIETGGELIKRREGMAKRGGLPPDETLLRGCVWLPQCPGALKPAYVIDQPSIYHTTPGYSSAVL